MNISGLLQSKRKALWASLTLQETRSIHDSMNIPKHWIHFLIIIFTVCLRPFHIHTETEPKPNRKNKMP